MKIKKTAVLSAGSLMIVSSITPVFAKSVESISNNTNLIQVCSDGITDSADIITQYVEGIEIKKEQPVEEVPVYNEVTYTYEAVDNSSTQTMTVDEFMALYGQMMEKESE